MTRNAAWAILVPILVLASSAHALDRGAQRIERLELQAGFPKEGDRYAAFVTSESALPETGGVWALRASLGGGSIDPDKAPSQTFWGGELGLSHHLTPLTKLSLTGGYVYQDLPSRHADIWSANLYARQRLLSASEPVSPYIELRTALRRIGVPRDATGSRKSTHDLVLAGVGGLEIRMRHDFSIVFEAGAAHSETFSEGRKRADGVFAAIAMQYYWH